MDEEAVARLVSVEADELEVAQSLQAVAEPVGVGLHGDDLELGAAGLHVEEEEQPIHPGQAVVLEIGGVALVVEAEDGLLLAGAAVVDGLAGQQLDRAAHAVLEVAGDGVGVLVAGLLERVVQAAAAVGVEGVAVQERAERA